MGPVSDPGPRQGPLLAGVLSLPFPRAAMLTLGEGTSAPNSCEGGCQEPGPRDLSWMTLTPQPQDRRCWRQGPSLHPSFQAQEADRWGGQSLGSLGPQHPFQAPQSPRPPEEEGQESSASALLASRVMYFSAVGLSRAYCRLSGTSLLSPNCVHRHPACSSGNPSVSRHCCRVLGGTSAPEKGAGDLTKPSALHDWVNSGRQFPSLSLSVPVCKAYDQAAGRLNQGRLCC